jgi:hypothetical protein
VLGLNLDTKTSSGTGSSSYSNAHSISWEALTAHYGLADIYRLHHGAKAGGFTRYHHNGSIATRTDRLYGPRYNSPWRWTYIDGYHNIFTNNNSRSDHLPVLATVKTARARKSTARELKIDKSLYADLQVRRQITLIWEAIYEKYLPDQHSHAVSYSKAKEAVSAHLRQLTREKKQKLYPTTEVRRELAQLGLILGARGPHPNLLAQKEAH